MTFKFDMGQTVEIPTPANTPERSGVIIGRAEWTTGAPNQYCVRGFDADGNPADRWFDESELDA